MDRFEVHIDRERWADMRRNSRIGLAGATIGGLLLGAWLVGAAIVSERPSSLVPGVLLLVTGLVAGWSWMAKRSQQVEQSGPALLFALDREGLHLEPAVGDAEGGRFHPWGSVELKWLHTSGSYLEIRPAEGANQRWPVIVLDVSRDRLDAAIRDVSGGTARLR